MLYSLHFKVLNQCALIDFSFNQITTSQLKNKNVKKIGFAYYTKIIFVIEFDNVMMANQYMFFNIPQSIGISQLYFAV